MTPEIQKRLTRVAQSLKQIHARLDTKPNQKKALDQAPLDMKKVAPVVNSVDEKIKLMDKNTTSLLNALDAGKDNIAKNILKNLVKQIDGLMAIKDKGLAMYASAGKPEKAVALNKALARAKTVVARAKRTLG